MRDYQLDHNQLHQFSQSLPYGLHSDRLEFLTKLNTIKEQLNFPAVTNDVGSLLQMLLKRSQVRKIFEFGSGYGHSLFWYCELSTVDKIVLTEKREDLLTYFHQIQWPHHILRATEYYQGDAFERFNADSELYDFIFMDGVKASYKDFLELAIKRLSEHGLIAIDNSYWRGSFLDPQMQHKSSAMAVAKLHQYVASLEEFEAIFIPYLDGLTLIQRKSV